MSAFSVGVFAQALTVKNTDDSGTGSLRRLIEIASDGDSIVFDGSLNGKTIELLSVIIVNKSIIINGNNKIALSGRNTNRIFYVKENSTHLELRDITIKEGKAPEKEDGGAIIVLSASLSVINCLLKNNSSDNYGGAIHIMQSASLTVINSTFENNNAKSGGSSIYNTSGMTSLTTTITGSTFNNNTGSCVFSQGKRILI